MASAPRRSRWILRILLGVSLLIVFSACSPAAFTQTPFVRGAGDAASLLSAASTTIEYAHSGKLDDRYARSSLRIHRESLAGMATTLSGQRGAPDDATLAPVIDRLRAAEGALADPCLDDTCDWRSQLDALDDASRALLALSQ